MARCNRRRDNLRIELGDVHECGKRKQEGRDARRARKDGVADFLCCSVVHRRSHAFALKRTDPPFPPFSR